MIYDQSSNGRCSTGPYQGGLGGDRGAAGLAGSLARQAHRPDRRSHDAPSPSARARAADCASTEDHPRGPACHLIESGVSPAASKREHVEV
jgi:hypothetical protein